MSGGITKTLYIPDMSGDMVKRTVVAKYNSDDDEFSVIVPAYLIGSAHGWSKSGNEAWQATGTNGSITGKSPAELFKAVEVAGRVYLESLKKGACPFRKRRFNAS